MFVGRKKELSYLDDLYTKGKSNVLCMYGYKGIGKTSLVLNFATDKNTVYYQARSCSPEEQLVIAGEELGVSYEGVMPNYFTFFKGLNFEDGEKKVLIIDEFQNIIKYSDDFMPELMRYVSSCEDGILVILVSSSISFVENTFVSKIGKLSQMLSGFYKVLPLSFMDCVNYFTGYDTEDCMRVFSILGGNPSYWVRFSTKLSVDENIKRCILHNDAPLRNEGMNLINEELREISVYSTLLYCMANGMNKLNELHVATGYSRAKISVYIKNLMELELVEKVFSFDNASSINAKKGVYRIKVPYLHFYFKFIFKNESKLNLLGPAKFFGTYVQPFIDDYYDCNFKFVCNEYLCILNQMNKLPISFNKSGEWVGKRGSIDIILQDDDDDSIVSFCLWKKEKVTVRDYKLFLKICEEARIHPDYMMIFAKGEFEPDMLRLENSLDNLQLIRTCTL